MNPATRDGKNGWTMIKGRFVQKRSSTSSDGESRGVHPSCTQTDHPSAPALGGHCRPAADAGARAATLTVNSILDPGDAGTCTLRQAIDSVTAVSNQGGCEAVGAYGTNDTILFNASVTGTITLNNGELLIQRDLVIDGPGAAQLAVDGDAKSRVFNISSGTPTPDPLNVTIEGLTIRNGSVADHGGGIRLDVYVSLALTDSTVSGNSALFGGGVFAWFYNTLTLTNSTVSGNSAADGGGVVAFTNNTLMLTNSTVSGNSARGRGGGVDANANNTLTLTNSTVSGNSSRYGGGGVFAGVGNALTLTNSTVSGNSATTHGGGVFAGSDNTLTLTNSTVSGNSAVESGGGVFADYGNTLTLTNSTVSGNSAAVVGGVHSSQFREEGNTLTLINSLLANSTGGDCVADLSTVTGTNNLIEDDANACGLTNTVNGNIIGQDPVLGPLADNGCVIPSGVPGTPDYGCVQTHALLDGSPALNAADAEVCAIPPISAIDERGAGRPQGGGCDIGAFERGWPGAPTQVTVAPGVKRVTVSWTPPGDPGLGALDSCTATAEPGGASCSAPAGTNQCTISGLTPGTAYRVSVVCTNDEGISGFTSAASEPVTPRPSPPTPVPAVSAAGLLGGAGLLGLLGAWRLRRQARRRGR